MNGAYRNAAIRGKDVFMSCTDLIDLKFQELKRILDDAPKFPERARAEKILYIHPDNKHVLDSIREKYQREEANHPFMMAIRPFGIRVQFSEHVPKEKWTGRWIRQTVLQDDRFTTWVCEEDLKSPQSWQIFFGLVIKEMEPTYYLVDEVPSSITKGLRDNEFLVHRRPTLPPFKNYPIMP